MKAERDKFSKERAAKADQDQFCGLGALAGGRPTVMVRGIPSISALPAKFDLMGPPDRIMRESCWIKALARGRIHRV